MDDFTGLLHIKDDDSPGDQSHNEALTGVLEDHFSAPTKKKYIVFRKIPKGTLQLGEFHERIYDTGSVEVDEFWMSNLITVEVAEENQYSDFCEPGMWVKPQSLLAFCNKLRQTFGVKATWITEIQWLHAVQSGKWLKSYNQVLFKEEFHGLCYDKNKVEWGPYSTKEGRLVQNRWEVCERVLPKKRRLGYILPDTKSVDKAITDNKILQALENTDSKTEVEISLLLKSKQSQVIEAIEPCAMTKSKGIGTVLSTLLLRSSDQLEFPYIDSRIPSVDGKVYVSGNDELSNQARYGFRIVLPKKPRF